MMSPPGMVDFPLLIKGIRIKYLPDKDYSQRSLVSQHI